MKRVNEEVIRLKLESISEPLMDRVHSKKEIMALIHKGLSSQFAFSDISIYLLDTFLNEIDLTFPSEHIWPLPAKERDWILKHVKDSMVEQTRDNIHQLYIEDRDSFYHTDTKQFVRDQARYDYSCADQLYLCLISEENIPLGIISIHNWGKKEKLFNSSLELQAFLETVRPFLSDVILALDSLLMHTKIESLLSDKNELKQRIQKDEESLKRRLSELTALYDTSNQLASSLNYMQIITVVFDSIVKVLNFDLGAIFIWDFVPEGEVVIRANRPLPNILIERVNTNVLSAISPFIDREFNPETTKLTIQKKYDGNQAKLLTDQMTSYANVPLIFKEEVIGMLNVCSTNRNAFSRNEMTFLHTMANQLASNIGRLKLIKQQEKSKMTTLINSMSDGVMMIDQNHRVEVINPAMMEYLGLSETDDIVQHSLSDTINQPEVLTLYEEVSQTYRPVADQRVISGNRTFSVNLNPVKNPGSGQIGTVFVYRDVSELEKVGHMNKQRLSAISQVNELIRSINDFDNLLKLLMEFVLDIAEADMGSILLREGTVFYSKIHANFPDKTRRFYKYKTGETISDFVIRTHKTCYIEDYPNTPDVVTNVKVPIRSYLCIPITVGSELIGVLNIVHKANNTTSPISDGEIETLKTLTTIFGTTIQNAMLYENTIEKQKMDQELKIANEIQTKLLPQTLPNLEKISFGALTVPAHEIGGDYYDFFPLKNGQLGIIVVDFIGKGVPAGLFMAMLKSILTTHLPSIYSPKEALTKLNELLINDSVLNKFIPMIYGILDPETQRFTYCNAGHEPGFYFSSQGTVLPLDTEGMPLGAFEGSAYEEKSIQLNDQDCIVLVTDGIIEANNKSGERFGIEALQKIVKKHPVDKDAASLCDSIYTSVTQFSEGAHQHDDLTIVTLKLDCARKKIEEEQCVFKKEMEVTSSKKEIKIVRGEIDSLCTKFGFNDTDIYNIKLAVNEAQANVIEHAYFGSETGTILFKFLVFQDRLEIRIKDFGPGVELKSIKSEEHHLQDLEGSGLGVFLINSIMDDVKYHFKENGTELIMVKNR